MGIVKGHTLWQEGSAFLWAEAKWQRAPYSYGGVSGIGRGVCSCGASSGILTSAYQRKKWHREHKAEVPK